MPDQGVTVDFNIVLLSIFNHFICKVKIIFVPLRMNDLRFHNIFRCGSIELFGNQLAALVSFSSICWVLSAVPIKKSFLYASLNVGVAVDVVAFLLLLQEMNVTEIATVVKLNKKFLFISIVFIYLIVLVSGGPR